VKLTIKRTALLGAMYKAAAIADGRSTIPILQHAALTAQDGVLTIRASNMDIEIVCKAKADVHEDGETTVQGARLYDIARASAEGSEISMTLGETRLAVKSGRSVYQLATLPIDTFPTFAVVEPTAQFEIQSRVLRVMILRTGAVANADKARPMFCSVYLFNQSNRFGAVATDGKRLVLTERDMEGTAFGAIIPMPAVTQIARICDMDGTATVSVSDSRVMVESGETVLTAKLMGGDYVDFRRVIPKPGPRVVKVGREALAASVRRTLLAADDQARSVRLKLAPGSLTLEARGQDAEGSDEVSCSYDGDDFTAGFSGVFLAEAVGSFADDVINWAHGEKNDYPTIMTAEDEPGVTYVLMGHRA
jgi:DNA polymerase-3 subunit beta